MDQVTSGETFAAQAGEVLFGRAGGVVFSLDRRRGGAGQSRGGGDVGAARLFRDGARRIVCPLSRVAAPALRNAGARDRAAGGARFDTGRWSARFNDIISYFVFVVIVFIGLTVMALFKLRRRDPNSVGFLTPGYPVTPVDLSRA